jgi:predicted aspartyl protease
MRRSCFDLSGGRLAIGRGRFTRLRFAVAASVALVLAFGASAEEGVLADLPFLDSVPEWGEIGTTHVAIDLSGNPDRPFPMILDTGASFSVMTPRYARAVGVTVRRLRDRPYRKATLLGRDLQFWVDVRRSDTAARTFEAGLLGANFLEKYVVEVDYAARRVRLLDPGGWGTVEEHLSPGEVVAPMRFTTSRPTVEIALGSGTAWFLMDTGAPSGLHVSEERARALGLEWDEDGPIREGQNVIGSDRAVETRLAEVRIGSHVVQDVELLIALQSGSSYRITNIAGPDEALLGTAFLERFRVRFDYPARKVAFLPVARSGDAVPEDTGAPLEPPSTEAVEGARSERSSPRAEGDAASE